MKTLIILAATALMTVSAYAQEYYKDGALFKINDSLTLKCVTFKSTIGILNVKTYPRARQENNVADIKDRSAFKRAFEETFTPSELEKYQNMTFSLGVIHNSLLKPVDVEFAFQNKAPGNTIPPAKFATLRQKLIDYLEFKPIFTLEPDLYYNWDEGVIAPIRYYLEPTK